jgi:hypothetical protein
MYQPGVSWQHSARGFYEWQSLLKSIFQGPPILNPSLQKQIIQDFLPGAIRNSFFFGFLTRG